jgi:anti-sigma B factor antagonist
MPLYEMTPGFSGSTLEGVTFLTGELDADVLPPLRAALDDALALGGERVVLDLGGVTFCDSSALREILGVLQRSDGRPVVLRNTRAPVRRLLDITGVEGRFTLEDVPSG